MSERASKAMFIGAGSSGRGSGELGSEDVFLVCRARSMRCPMYYKGLLTTRVSASQNSIHGPYAMNSWVKMNVSAGNCTALRIALNLVHPCIPYPSSTI